MCKASELEACLQLVIPGNVTTIGQYFRQPTRKKLRICFPDEELLSEQTLVEANAIPLASLATDLAAIRRVRPCLHCLRGKMYETMTIEVPSPYWTKEKAENVLFRTSRTGRLYPPTVHIL